jgi:3-hydroxyisobutyrate dehydrogenase-like beta-hydroxyacid dehydrogenase
MKVGFIGLGAMGLPMAKNVIKGGHEVFTTFHKRREPAEELAALGAKIKGTPADIAQEADVIVTVLPADTELKETVLGEAGLIKSFSKGKVLIDMTTATAFSLQDVEEALAQVGGRVLDAPVSGGTPAAADGSLTIMVGGDTDLLDEYQPLLETMGKTIFHVGGVGQGKVVKMVNQLMAAIHILAIGEAFSLGVKGGADPNVLYEVIKSSSGYSKMMDLRLPDFLLKGSFEPGFKLDLMKKDVNLAVDSAKAFGTPLFFGGMTSQVFAAASAANRGEQDFSAAAQFLSELAQVQLMSTSS